MRYLNKQSLVTVIDADSIGFIISYNYRDSDDIDAVIANTDKYVQSLIDNTSCTHYIGFLGGSKETFRHRIAVTKPYKGQRPPSPEWYKKWGGVIKAHLRDVWHFQVVNDIEADDAVSIASEELKRLDINHILCHADKDIRQKSGNHYNLRTHKREFISKVDADKNFYKQVLIGDGTDNIEGLKGIGKKKASQYIDGLSSAREMKLACINLFCNKHGVNGLNLFEEMSSLCLLLETAQPYTTLPLNYIPVTRPDIFPQSDMEAILADIWE